ncbi:hypothetical protein A6035_09950 [Dietzia lutea]|uniref:Uncharacterized protein n=1 Tax=Dietzia lutea TaxID=546160 RepID=A0A2S1R875_9ACTN|nr:hypothetical protein A6035_09950 [Dietzia lutea]
MDDENPMELASPFGGLTERDPKFHWVAELEPPVESDLPTTCEFVHYFMPWDEPRAKRGQIVKDLRRAAREQMKLNGHPKATRIVRITHRATGRVAYPGRH